MLVFIIVTMTVVAVMGAAIFSLNSSTTYSELFINSRNKAYYLAQAGRNYATMTILNAYNSGDIAVITALNGQTFSLDGNQFYISTNKQSSGITLVESTGIVNPGTALETKQKIAFTVRDPTVINGAASVGVFTLNSYSVVDGYDSTVRPYDPVLDPPLNLAVIQTNSLANGAVTLNRGTIYGKAYCGVGCVPDPCDAAGGIFVCYSASTITQGTYAADKNNPTPILVLPSGGTPKMINGSSGCIQNQTTNIGPGKWLAQASNGTTSNVSLCVNNSTINISGDVTLIVDGTLSMINASSINLAEGATLVLWIRTLLEVGGTSRINYQAPPPNVLVKGIEMSELHFVQDSRTYCSIYSPGAIVNVDNTSEVWGSFYAKEINLNGGKLHCDMAFSETKNTYVGY